MTPNVRAPKSNQLKIPSLGTSLSDSSAIAPAECGVQHTFMLDFVLLFHAGVSMSELIEEDYGIGDVVS